MIREQHIRTALLLGEKGLDKLASATVGVVGLGGVGGHAAEALARIGLKKIILVDYDLIQQSNINRQIIAHTDNIGCMKTDEFQKRLSLIDPHLLVECQSVFADADNFSDLIGECDYIVDAIDSLEAKINLLEYCYRADKYVVTVFGAGNRLDASSVRTGDISQSSVCPLGRRVRKALRERGIDSGIAAVWSIEEPLSIDESIILEDQPSKRPIGSCSYMPGIMGLTAASLVIKAITNRN